MKKLMILAIIIGLAGTAFAQPDVTTAYNLNNQGKFEEAMTYIEKAAGDTKATSKEKYWRYRGNIYLNIAQDAALAAKYPDALIIAVQSYKKSKELDKYGDYATEVQTSMGNAQRLTNEKGDKAYSAGDFCTAAKSFELALEISDTYSILDSAFVFNTAYCYDRCGESAKAISGYQRCASINYNVPAVYVYIAEIHLKNNDKEAASKVLAEARAKYPKDADLLRTEVGIYLNDGNYEKAEQILTALTETDAKNETVWFVLGVTYGKLGKKTDEENAYKKSLELKPDYYDALFNMGAMYFNDGLETEKTCAEIPPREKDKYNDCIARVKTQFTRSVEILERAYNVKPEREIISALKDAYYKTERMEDYERMKALLK
jgi:tetratricopeptide (TPR) repeat protein